MSWREGIAQRLERILRRHVVDVWYPRTVDRDLGGFLTDLDRQWRRVGPDERMLEYQARQTRTVARLGAAFPSDPQWLDFTRHGSRYLADMRDDEHGGWFWLVDRDLSPLAFGTKHAHSTAYVIGALVEVYRLTADDAALDAAQAAFDWLDAVLHDRDNGGYHGWSTRSGKPILDRSQVNGWIASGDPLGHDIGLKDLNVHADLCESFRLLLAERPGDRLRERADELYDIIEQCFTGADGAMHYLLRPDLTPVDGPERPGYALQLAYRLPQLASYLHRPTDEALGRERQRVDRALATGWVSDKGGVVDIVGDGPRARSWWVQAEALQALLLLDVTFESDVYRGMVEQMVALIEHEMVDERYGGMYETPTSDWSALDRLRSTRAHKAHRWKDASHEADMCLMSIRMLRGLPAEGPLRP